MNRSIDHLAALAQKETKEIIGLMSGTSLDGLDLAHCRFKGCGKRVQVQLVNFKTIPYPSNVEGPLKEIVFKDQTSLEDVCLLHTHLGKLFGNYVLTTLEEWGVKPEAIDCIASHGQTVYHAPSIFHQRNDFSDATLQIGDGDHIASATGILTISDFRQKHTAAGGEGAPLVAPVDELMFRDARVDRLLLNIGGIANFTYLPAHNSEGVPVTTDTGPGNTLMNEAARRFWKIPYDTNGEKAAAGEVQRKVLALLKAHPFFDRKLPKTTGPELFNWSFFQEALLKAGREQIQENDTMATLAEFTAETIAEAVMTVHQDRSPLEIYLSGGGMHNLHLVNRINQKLPSAKINSFGDIGFNPDAKEAVCFAVLANETLSGEGFTLSSGDQETRVNFGKISFPS